MVCLLQHECSFEFDQRSESSVGKGEIGGGGEEGGGGEREREREREIKNGV